MNMKPLPLTFILAALILFGGSVANSRAAAPDLPRDLKGILENYDAQFMASLRLELDVTAPTHAEPIHGKSRAEVVMTSDAAGKHLDSLRTAVDPIKYVKTRESRTTPAGDRLDLCYDRHLSISQNREKWCIRHDTEAIGINADNSIARPASMMAPRLDILPSASQDGANLFYRYLLPLGRGYAQLLDRITAVSIDAGGIATVSATGSLFSPYSGVWTLEVDTRAGYLVRKASFTQNGAKRPGLSCTANRVHPGNLPLYEEGELTLSGNYQISVRLKEYSDVPEEVRATAGKIQDATSSASLPQGALLMDFRSIDGDLMPQMKKVRKVSDR